MKVLLRLGAALAVLCALAAPASALSRYADGAPIVLAQAAPAPSPVATQNTITTTAPVTSETTISVGTLAGQALMWLAAVFSVPVGALLSAWLWKLFTLAGVQTTDLMRARLQEMIVNGLNVGAKNAETALAGRGQLAIKNQAIADTVKYVQAHGAETLAYLGVDPKSNKAVEAIKARIETAIADTNTPTPAVLNVPSAAKPSTHPTK